MIRFWLLFYLYVWLVIDPRLIYHSLGLLTGYSGFAFSDGWPFLQEHLARPGGLVEYVAGFLSQLFSFGWVGALIVTLSAWSLCLFTDLMTALGAGLPTPPRSDRRAAALLETFGRPCGAVGSPHHSAGKPPEGGTTNKSQGSVVRYVPAAVLLVIFGRYYYPISTIVSLLAGLSCFAVYVNGTPGGTMHRLLVLLAAVTAAYHLAGGGSLIFPMLAATYELFVRRRTFVAVAALLCGLSVPWLVGTLRFGFSPEHAYGQFLLTDPGLTRADGPYGLILLAFFPLVLAWRGARFHRARHVGNVPHGRLGRAAQAVAVLVGMGGVAWFSLDTAVRTLLEMDDYSRQEKWAKVLQSARRMPRGLYSARCNRNVLLALYHTRRLGDEMFHYPQIRLMTPFRPPEDDGDYGALFQQSRLYFYLGQVNYAEKCAYDALGVAGDVPAVLEHLAVISVVRGRIGAAHVLLNALGKNPFYRGTATGMIRAIENDPRLEDDPRLRGMSSMVPDSDSFTRRINIKDVLVALLKKNRQNRMAFEFLMAHWLVTGRPEKVAEDTGRLIDLGYAQMPRHYQEALLICLGPDAAKFHAAPYEIQPDVIREFESFLAIVQREPDGQAAARDARAAGLGNTYFFFLTFDTSGS